MLLMTFSSDWIRITWWGFAIGVVTCDWTSHLLWICSKILGLKVKRSFDYRVLLLYIKVPTPNGLSVDNWM